ncbi:peptidase, partial [Xanthomonas citri pv. citri]|nr:peptidase [Xanthomonas citri pv. citri]
DVELTVTRTDAAMNTWTHGSMSWTTAKGKAVPEVTSPVTVKAKSATVTSAVEGSGATGSADVEITPGVTGELTPQVLGLGKVDSTVAAATASNSLASSALAVSTVTVEEGTQSLVASINAGAAGADWDLYVITP